MWEIIQSVLFIIEIIVGIGLIIFLHELGHFIMAKRNGVRVEVFSLGFGPAIIRRRRGETEYRLSWVPLGGYVKMAGEQHSDKEDPQPYDLTSKGTWPRLQIFAAGAIMNLIIAVPILTLAGLAGKLESDAVVGNPGWAESRAGILPGDRILKVDGDSVKSLDEYKMAVIAKSQNDSVQVLIERDGRTEVKQVQVRESPYHMITTPTTVVVGVVKDSALEKANVRARKKDTPGDIIHAVNGKRIYSRGDFNQLMKEHVGEETEITIFRPASMGSTSEGETFSVKVTPKWADPDKVPLQFPQENRLQQARIGSVGTGTAASRLNPETDDGESLLQPGDLITHIEGIPIASWHDLRESMKDRANKETEIQILRNNKNTDSEEKVTVTLWPGTQASLRGVLGIRRAPTAIIADVPAGSIYAEAGLKAGDRLISIGGRTEDRDGDPVTVSALFLESTPAPVLKGPAFLQKLGTAGVFLLLTIVFGLITLGPLTWLWLKKIETHRKREFMRITVTLIPALVATFMFTKFWPRETPKVGPINVEVAREGEAEKLVLTIIPTKPKSIDLAAIGWDDFDMQRIHRSRSFGEAVVYGFEEPMIIFHLTVHLLKKLVFAEESPKGLAGPVGIFQFSYRSAQMGFGNLLWMLGLITLNLGIFNLLPIPLLDGGHVALLGYEAIARRRPSLAFEVIYQWTGLVLLLGLIVFVTWNDITRMIFPP